MADLPVKELQSITKYDGDKSQWPPFKFVLCSLIGAKNPEMLQRMTQAAALTEPIVMGSLSDEDRQMSRKLMFALSQVLGPTSLTLVMNIDDGNGLEAWRSLVSREDPSDGISLVSQLLSMLTQGLAVTEQGKLMAAIDKLELRMRRYESAASEVLSDSLMQAILLVNLPEAFREQLMMRSHRTYGDLKAAVSSIVSSKEVAITLRSVSSSANQAVPMEIGAIDRSKGKSRGKGKDKGKDKGKSKSKSKQSDGGDERKDDPEFWNRQCSWCGLYGHKKHSCWSRKAYLEQQEWLEQYGENKPPQGNGDAMQIGHVHGLEDNDDDDNDGQNTCNGDDSSANWVF